MGNTLREIVAVPRMNREMGVLPDAGMESGFPLPMADSACCARELDCAPSAKRWPWRVALPVIVFVFVLWRAAIFDIVQEFLLLHDGFLRVEVVFR